LSNIFFEIGIIIIVAALGGFIFRLIKQPLLPLYILIGLLIGPIFKLIPSDTNIAHLSEIGVALLLFIVGLEIELPRLKKAGPLLRAGVVTAVIQTSVIFVLGYLLGTKFGLSKFASFYLGLAASFSSTMVAVKLLSDKRELGTVWGRISIIILILQDILALLALIFISTAGNLNLSSLIFVLSKSILLIILGILFGKFIFPSFFRFAAKSEELLFITAIAVCFAFAILSKALGLTYAIGAFIAGLSLANLDFSYQIVSKIKPIRDFFAVLFFVSLGIMINPKAICAFPFLVLLLTIIVITLKPIIVFFSLSLFRFKKDVSFNSAVSLAQISEFSIIIAGVGLALSQINEEIFSIISFALFASVVISAYLFDFHRFLNHKLGKILKIFERKNSFRLENKPAQLKNHVVVFGYHRTAEKIVETLKKLNKEILVVDFDPDVIENLKNTKLNYLYGDMGDMEILKDADIDKAEIIVSTVPNTADNLLMLKEVNAKNPNSLTYVSATEIEDALELYRAGADYVIMPHFLSGEHTSILLKKFAAEPARILLEKEKQVNKLKEFKKNDLQQKKK